MYLLLLPYVEYRYTLSVCWRKCPPHFTVEATSTAQPAPVTLGSFWGSGCWELWKSGSNCELLRPI